MAAMPAHRFFTKAIDTLLDNAQARSVTVFVSPALRVTATYVHRPELRRANARQVTFSVTYGQPNYAGCHFVKMCKRAGEPFPVAKPQIKFWPKKRK